MQPSRAGNGCSGKIKNIRAAAIISAQLVNTDFLKDGERRRTGLTYTIMFKPQDGKSLIMKIEATSYKVDMRGDILFRNGRKKVGYVHGADISYIYTNDFGEKHIIY